MSRGSEHHSEPPILAEGLASASMWAGAKPKIALWLVGISAVVCAAVSVGWLGFKTNRSDLIDPSEEFHRRWLSYTESFGERNDLVVAIEGEDAIAIKGALDDLGGRIEKEEKLFKQVLYRIEPGQMGGRGLAQIDPEILRSGLKGLDRGSHRMALDDRWGSLRLDLVLSQIAAEIKAARKTAAHSNIRTISNSTAENAAVERARRLAASLEAFVADPSDFRSPWHSLFPIDSDIRDRGRSTTYFLNNDGTMGLLFVSPDEEAAAGFDGPTQSIDRLRELIADVKESHPGIEIGLTGVPVLENDEMRKSKTDMLWASLISTAGVALVLLLGFRGLRHPLLVVLMLGVGMAWTFGYTTLVVGHLNILSVSFAVILIGLGIDFGIHYIARYLEERKNGDDLESALGETSATVGVGIVAAAVTTAMAFFCATMTSFLGVAELGLIAGGGILLCAAAAFIVLPALIALSDRDVSPQKLPTPFRGEMLRSSISKMPLVVLVVSLTAVLGLAACTIEYKDGEFYSKVDYDHNLLHLQADDLESVALQNRIFEKSDHSLLYAVSVAETPQEARELRRKFEALPTVHHCEELASRLPGSATRETTNLVYTIGGRLSRLPTQPRRAVIRNPAPIGRAAEACYSELKKSSHPSAIAAAKSLDGFLDGFAAMSLTKQIKYLNAYQARMAVSIHKQLSTYRAAVNVNGTRLEDFPPAMKERFVSKEGKWLVQIYPKEQIWDAGPLATFVEDVRSVDPNVTGTPLQNFEASRQIKDSYERAALYAFAVVLLVLLIDFLRREYKLAVLLPPLAIVAFMAATMQVRHVEYHPTLLVAAYLAMVLFIGALLDAKNTRDSLLAMFPPIAGGLMMFGILALLKIDLNPANLIVLPLVLGIGVDDGVHVVHDYRSQEGRYKPSSSTINGIVLTSLTSMIGFGSLMIASHNGLASVGQVLVIGIGSCLFVSLVALPAMLTLFSRRSETREEEHREDRREQRRRAA